MVKEKRKRYDMSQEQYRSRTKVFKPGDKVMCIADPVAMKDMKGKIFTVSRFYDVGKYYDESTAISTRENISGVWYTGRFVLANVYNGERVKKEI
jgi:hypothetical protein